MVAKGSIWDCTCIVIPCGCGSSIFRPCQISSLGESPCNYLLVMRCAPDARKTLLSIQQFKMFQAYKRAKPRGGYNKERS